MNHVRSTNRSRKLVGLSLLMVAGLFLLVPGGDSTNPPVSEDALVASSIPGDDPTARPAAVVDPCAPPSRAFPADSGEPARQGEEAGESSSPADPRAKMSRDLVALLDRSTPPLPLRVIVQVEVPGLEGKEALGQLRRWVTERGSRATKDLGLIGAAVLEIESPQTLLALAGEGMVTRLSLDTRMRANLDIAARAIGADQVWPDAVTGEGYDGAGVTIAVLDSGVDKGHHDFEIDREDKKDYKDTLKDLKDRMEERVDVDVDVKERILSVDFVKSGNKGKDKYGHGTHVTGIFGSNGMTTRGENDTVPIVGIAPGATVLNLRVLDDDGLGFASTVIEAIDYVIAVRDICNVRVMNLSLGHPVFESYETDPLTLACARAVEAGITVACSAGNHGESDGQILYGGINSPGNAPWVITVGASKTNGTVARSDDEVALYSSRGPTAIDGLIKPDLVAPGDRLVNCQASHSYLAKNYENLTVPRGKHKNEYMVLSGTSMSTPMVSGTVALMLQANPSLTPSAVKAILLYTAEKMTDPDLLSQGSGLLNTEGAVRLATAVRPDSDSVAPGQLWLNGNSPEDLVGAILPYTFIDGEQVYWGSTFAWGDGIMWSNGLVWSNGIVWGNGIMWSNGILWANGEPWFDSLMVFKQPAYANGIVWSHAGEDNSVLWSDGILWAFSNEGAGDSVDGDGIMWSNGLLWSNSDLFDSWSPLFVDPESILPEQHEDDAPGVLVWGESFPGGDYRYGDVGAWYYPRQPE